MEPQNALLINGNPQIPQNQWNPPKSMEPQNAPIISGNPKYHKINGNPRINGNRKIHPSHKCYLAMPLF